MREYLYAYYETSNKNLKVSHLNLNRLSSTFYLLNSIIILTTKHFIYLFIYLVIHSLSHSLNNDYTVPSYFAINKASALKLDKPIKLYFIGLDLSKPIKYYDATRLVSSFFFLYQG